MPFNNLSDKHFSPAEQQRALDLLEELRTLMMPRLANLNPDERKKYGRIKEQNKLFVHKVKDYNAHSPQLCSPDIDWHEFLQDVATREFLATSISSMKNLILAAENARILHDHDLYQACLIDYKYARYKLTTDTGASYENKYVQLKQFFPNTGKKWKAKNTDNT